MVFIRFVTLFISLALFPASSVWAAGAKSPEGLAFVLANAYRSGDSAAIVALHYFIPGQYALADKQRIAARGNWRRLIKQYRLSGYRVSMLSMRDREIARRGLKPVKKLVMTLARRGSSEKRSANLIIVHVDGGFFVIDRNSVLQE